MINLIPKQTPEKIEKIQKAFIWINLTPKIKPVTLHNSFENNGPKTIDVNIKVISL